MDRSFRILTVAEICRVFTISRSTFYRERSKPGFPRPVRLSPGRVGYIESEIEEWFLGPHRRGPR